MAKISVDSNVVDHDGLTVLMIAAKDGDFKRVKELLTDKRVDPKVTTQAGFTALMIAAETGHSH